MSDAENKTPEEKPEEGATGGGEAKKPAETPVESGGPKGKEPTRYGDWEINGKCVDF